MRALNLIQIDGSVTFHDNNYLSSVKGLTSLTHIGGDLTFYVTPSFVASDASITCLRCASFLPFDIISIGQQSISIICRI
jgi:hypothetical protein